MLWDPVQVTSIFSIGGAQLTQHYKGQQIALCSEHYFPRIHQLYCFIYKLQIMSKLRNQITDFTQRISQTLQLTTNQTLDSWILLQKWASQQLQAITKQIEKQSAKTKESFFSKLLNRNKGSEMDINLFRKQVEKELNRLLMHLNNNNSDQFQFVNIEPPEEIKQALTILKSKSTNFSLYQLSGPLIGSHFLTKQKKDQIMEKNIEVNNLKFIRIHLEKVHKCQRVLLQEVMGRVFRDQGNLCVVVSTIPVKQTISPTYYLITDTSLLKTVDVDFGDLRYNPDSQTICLKDNEEVTVDEDKIIQLLISELMTLQLQTFTSQFGCVKEKKGNKTELRIIKYFDYSQQNQKDYTGLRSSLFFFKQYFEQRQFPIEKIQNAIYKFGTFCRYFDAVQIIIDMKKEDFKVSLNFGSNKILIPSLLFPEESVSIVNSIFHNILVLKEWLQQVVKPIRKTIALSSIIQQICPLVNYINAPGISTPLQYSNLINRLDFTSFKADKKDLNQYLDTYLPLNTEHLIKDFLIHKNIIDVNKIFRKFLDLIDLKNYKPEQAVHLIQIYVQNTQSVNFQNLNPQWKNIQVWKSLFDALQNQIADFSIVDVGVEMMPFYLGLDPVTFGYPDYFNLLKNTQETPKKLNDISNFGELLKNQFKSVFNQRIIHFLDKCFLYRKLKIATLILERFPVKNMQFKRLIEVTKDNNVPSQDKKNLLDILQKVHPSRFRKFKWEQIFLDKLQQLDGTKEYTSIETFDFGQCYIRKDILQKILNREENVLTLNTRTLNKDNNSPDYMYTLKHDVARIEDGSVVFYVQQVDVPGFDYFFGKLLQTLNISYIKPFTTYFVLHNQVLQFTEHLNDGFSYQNVLKTYNEDFICNQVQKDVLSEAILVSLLINPSSIGFEDIVLRIYRQQKYHIYIKKFESYNAYAYTTSQPSLKMKNALLLFSTMHESVPTSVMTKYASINVQQKIRALFKKLKYFCKRMEEMQDNSKESQQVFKYKKPFLGIPFEKDFIVRLSQRFYRIVDIFQKNLKQKTTVTHFDLLQKLAPVVGLYYRSLHQMALTPEQQWNAVQKTHNFKTNFVDGDLFSFFCSFSQYQIPESSYYPHNLQKLQSIGVSQCLLRLKQEQSKSEIFLRSSEEDIKILLEKEDGNNIQFFMRNIDMRSYSQQTQRFILDRYRKLSYRQLNNGKYKTLESFYLLGCNVILEKTLAQFRLEWITYMVLENCSVITELEMSMISQKLKCLTYLRLQKIPNLTYFSSSKNKTTNSSQPIKFPILTTLVVNLCQNLVSIDIKCSSLTNIDLKRNPNLESIYIDSNSLKKISSISNPELNIQNIGFYVFMGVDVFIDKKSSHGDLTKIITSENEIDYSEKLNSVFYYILQHMLEIKASSNLFLTMYKSNKIQKNLKNTATNMISSVASKYLGSNYKMDSEKQKFILDQLVSFWIRNKKLQDFKVSENYLNDKESALNKRLIGSIISCLKIMKESKETKTLKSIVFTELQQKALDSILEVLQIIRSDDHLTVEISNYSSHVQKYNNILLSFGKSDLIPKIKLKLTNSALQDSYFKQICECIGHKLISLELMRCQKMVTIIQEISATTVFEKCKSISIKECQLNNFSFLSSLQHVHSLEIVSSPIHGFKSLVSNLKPLKNLESLKLNNVFQSSNQVDQFIQSMQPSKISLLDLSNNIFEKKDLQSINHLLQNFSIHEFVLIKWTLKGQFDFSNFLKKSQIKKLSIQLQRLSSINQFVSSIAGNPNILSAEIITDQDYNAYDLSPFQLLNNTSIEQFRIKIKLPLWMVNLLARNAQRKTIRSSKIFPFANIPKKKIFDISSNKGAFKIGLSLDGGGMRGLLLATQLHYLCQKTNKPLHKMFDLIGGTSIGGILALAATGTLDRKNPICSTYEMKQIFIKYGKIIFEKNILQAMKILFGSKHSGAGIEGVLSDYFKSCKLSDVLPDTNCLVTSVRRENNMVKIFSSKQAKLNVSKDFYMRDIGRATSAAPIFFPSAEITSLSFKHYSLIDGGVGQNNPSKIVIEELRNSAISSGVQGKYFLVTLGTGRTNNQSKMIPQNAGYRNLEPIIDSFMESNSYFIQKQLQTHHKGKYIRVSPVLNLSPHDLKLDNTQPSVLREYENIGEMTAAEAFGYDNAHFGPFGDRSLIQWLAENADRKDE